MKNIIDYFVNKNSEKYLDIYKVAFTFAVAFEKEKSSQVSCERDLDF
jgi:hypothetical protein